MDERGNPNRRTQRLGRGGGGAGGGEDVQMEDPAGSESCRGVVGFSGVGLGKRLFGLNMPNPPPLILPPTCQHPQRDGHRVAVLGLFVAGRVRAPNRVFYRAIPPRGLPPPATCPHTFFVTVHRHFSLYPVSQALPALLARAHLR